MKCVVYRTGGKLNFKWHRTAAMPAQEAITALDEVRKQGYTSFIEDYERSVDIGLPSTYKYMQGAKP